MAQIKRFGVRVCASRIQSGWVFGSLGLVNEKESFFFFRQLFAAERSRFACMVVGVKVLPRTQTDGRFLRFFGLGLGHQEPEQSYDQSGHK